MDSSTIDAIRQRIKDARQSRVDSAMQLQETDSQVLVEQYDIDTENRRDQMTVGDKLAASGNALVEDTLAGEIGEEIGQSVSGVIEATNNPESNAFDYMNEIFQLDRNFDPNWKPNSNDEQWQMIQDMVSSEGLDPESNEANFLASAGSEKDLLDRFEEIGRTKEVMSQVSDGGALSQGAFFAGSMVDADMLVGGIAYKGLKQASRLKTTDRMVKAGKITKEEAAEFMTANSRLDNMFMGAEAGAFGSVVGEGGRVALSPTGDIEDVYGAFLVGTTFGTTVGSVLPTNPARKIAENLELKRAANFFKEKDYGGQSDMNRAFRFTESAEGGFANVPGDRGGVTSQGISSKYFPTQQKELQDLIDKGDMRGARKYRRDFYKNEFYDKVVDDSMTPAQKKAIYDASVHHGVGKAKELYAKAGGDVNKLLDIRAQYMRDIVANDPSQEKFLDGWLNRVENLREDIRTDGGFIEEVNQMNYNNSVGAAAVGDGDDLAPALKNWDDWADEVLDENPVLDGMYDHMTGGDGNGLFEFVEADASPATRIAQQIGQGIYKGILKTPLKSDFDRLMGSGKIGRALAFKVYEDPLGRSTNNKSADATATYLNTEAANKYAPQATHHIDTYARDNDLGYSFLPKVRNKFNQDLSYYRADMNAGIVDDAQWHPSIVKASQEIDDAMEYTLTKLKEYGVDGFEDVQFNKGYVPRRYQQARFDDVLKSPGVSKRSVTQDFKTGLMKKNPDMDENDAFLYAAAIVDHLDRNESGIAGTLGMTTAAGEEQLYNTLQRMG